MAHRVAWVLTRGPIPEGMCVLHRCDNPPCCNPDHLFLGTRADNNRDRQNKGRTVVPDTRGERHGMAKLTADLVRDIRRRYAVGDVTMIELATEFRVARVTIERIVHRRNWKSVV